jgi:hypothetical protein
MTAEPFIGTYDPYIEFIGFGLLSGIYALTILIPSAAVLVRRLHDTERVLEVYRQSDNSSIRFRHTQRMGF